MGTDQKPKLRRRASAVSEAMFLMSLEKTLGVDVPPTLIIAHMYFKERIDVEMIKNVARERFFTVPRMRVTARDDPQTGHVVLEESDIQEMDVDYHVKVVEQKENVKWAQTDIDLFSSKLYEKDFDLQHPSWQINIIQELADGRSLIIFALDHALLDGVSAVHTLMECLDKESENQSLTDSRSLFNKRPTPSLHPLLKMQALLRGIKQASDPQITQTIPTNNKVIICKMASTDDKHARYYYIQGFFGPFLPADPPNLMKLKDHRNPGKIKSLSTTDPINISCIKELAKKYNNATVTDVLLGILTITIRKYFEEVVILHRTLM